MLGAGLWLLEGDRLVAFKGAVAGLLRAFGESIRAASAPSGRNRLYWDESTLEFNISVTLA